MLAPNSPADVAAAWGFSPDAVADEHAAARASVPILISAPAAQQVETVARRIHVAARSGTHPFLVVDARELPSEQTALLALCRRWFDSVAGGSLLIADVDTMTWRAQAGFLAVLDRMQPGGAPNAGMRLMSGTTAPLFERVVAGRFSEALFYRLNVIHLAHRRDDPIAH